MEPENEPWKRRFLLKTMIFSGSMLVFGWVIGIIISIDHRIRGAQLQGRWVSFQNLPGTRRMLGPQPDSFPKVHGCRASYVARILRKKTNEAWWEGPQVPYKDSTKWMSMWDRQKGKEGMQYTLSLEKARFGGHHCTITLDTLGGMRR